jgi:hypothetical protein
MRYARFSQACSSSRSVLDREPKVLPPAARACNSKCLSCCGQQVSSSSFVVVNKKAAVQTQPVIEGQRCCGQREHADTEEQQMSLFQRLAKE